MGSGDSWASEESLLEILELSPVGVTILDDAGQVMFWNSRLLEMLGGLQGETFADAAQRMFLSDEAEHQHLRAEFAACDHVREVEVRLQRADGRPAWALVTMQRLTFEQRPAALVWFYDTTQRKQAQLDLEASEDAMLSMLEASPIGAVIVDATGRVQFWNSRLIEILGCPGAGADAPGFERTLGTIVARGPVRDVAVELARPGGEPRQTLVSTEPIQFERQPGLVTWIYDVTELRRAHDAMEAAARVKSAFLATVSHELRTPMNGVVTLADLLVETPLDPQQAEMARTIRDAGRSLITIINDILDVSKIEAGRLDIEILPTCPREIVDSALALMRPRAEERGLRLALSVDPAVPEHVATDPTRLRQILLNLISNAIKFTERGAVAVDLWRDGEALSLAVTDSGIGMSPEQLSRLFQPFSQADVSTARRYGGTGLGLSICRGLVELLGGRLEVTSRVGIGSCFTVTIPAAVCAAPAVAADPAATAAAVRAWAAPSADTAREAGALILCAEDNATNRDVLGRVLARMGFAHEFVVDGAQALAALARGRYGLLLTDCHMPEIDGWELVRRIRAEEQASQRPRLPILALSADAGAGMAEVCTAAGMDGHLAKPIDQAALEAAILRHLPAAGRLRAPRDALRAPRDAPHRPAAPAPTGADPAVLDRSALHAIVGDDAAAVAEMLAAFVAAARPLVERLGQDLGQDLGDRADAHRAAHSLKSAARYAGAGTLGRLAAEAETALAEGRLEDARAATDRLPAAFAAVEAAIAAPTAPSPIDAAATRLLAMAEVLAAELDTADGPDALGQLRSRLDALFAGAAPDLANAAQRRALAQLLAVDDALTRRLQAPASGFSQAEVDALMQ